MRVFGRVLCRIDENSCFFVVCAANALVVFQVVEDICCVRPGFTGTSLFPFVWASLAILVCWKGTRGVDCVGST